MLIPDQKRRFGIFFILLTLTIPFAVAYYRSAVSDVKPYETWREQFRNRLTPAGADIPTDQVILAKDKKFVINKTCIVFKGLSRGVVLMDLYLLDLDPDIPYALKFTKQSVSDGIWLGNVQYQLVSVKKDLLKLKIRNSYSTL